MRITVIGSGMVGRALAGRLDGLGHEVVVATRDPAATLARDEPGNDATTYAAWATAHPRVRLVALAGSLADADLAVNATSGAGSESALRSAGLADRAGLVVLDIANPLDFSGGFPPRLSVVNDDSLAESLQRAFPQARVVKALNTINASVMVDPTALPEATDTFVAGDDEDAKSVVRGVVESFGWEPSRVVDLGPLRSARGLEMYLPLWLALLQSSGTAAFNVRVVRA